MNLSPTDFVEPDDPDKDHAKLSLSKNRLYLTYKLTSLPTFYLVSSDPWDQSGHLKHSISYYIRWRIEWYWILVSITPSSSRSRILSDFSNFTPCGYYYE
jgi:hypothetical protein